MTVPLTGPHFTMLPPVHLLPAVTQDSLFLEMIDARMKPYTDKQGMKVELTPVFSTTSPGSGLQSKGEHHARVSYTIVRVLGLCPHIIDSSHFHS